MLWMTVPTGMLASGSALPGLMSAAADERTRVAGAQADRSEDVAALAVFILAQCDEGAAVRVVLETDNLRGDIDLVALEVDDAVLLAVAAALMADGDAAVAVAAGVLLLENLDQGLLGLGMLVNAVEAGDGHVPAGRGNRTIGFNRHSLSLPYAMPSKISMFLESSLSLTTAFFQVFWKPAG